MKAGGLAAKGQSGHNLAVEAAPTVIIPHERQKRKINKAVKRNTGHFSCGPQHTARNYHFNLSTTPRENSGVKEEHRVMRTVKGNMTLEVPGVMPSTARTAGNAQISTNLTSSNTTGPSAEAS